MPGQSTGIKGLSFDYINEQVAPRQSPFDENGNRTDDFTSNQNPTMVSFFHYQYWTGSPADATNTRNFFAVNWRKFKSCKMQYWVGKDNKGGDAKPVHFFEETCIWVPFFPFPGSPQIPVIRVWDLKQPLMTTEYTSPGVTVNATIGSNISSTTYTSFRPFHEGDYLIWRKPTNPEADGDQNIYYKGIAYLS